MTGSDCSMFFPVHSYRLMHDKDHTKNDNYKKIMITILASTPVDNIILFCHLPL